MIRGQRFTVTLQKTASEKDVLTFVAKIAQTDGGKNLLKISHDEEAFKKTEPLQLISYEFSKKIKI